MFHLKFGDTKPSIEAKLLDESNVTIDLTGSTVKILMQHKLTGARKSFVCSILDPVKGLIRYNWSTTDFDIPGLYLAEFEITYPDNNIQTIPNNNYVEVYVAPDLNSSPPNPFIPYTSQIVVASTPAHILANAILGLSISGGLVSGNFTITFLGQTTANIDVTGTRQSLLTAINNLSNVEPGDLNIGNLSTSIDNTSIPLNITFGGQYANRAILANTDISLNTSGIVGGAITLNTTNVGGNGSPLGYPHGCILVYILNGNFIRFYVNVGDAYVSNWTPV